MVGRSTSCGVQKPQSTTAFRLGPSRSSWWLQSMQPGSCMQLCYSQDCHKCIATTKPCADGQLPPGWCRHPKQSCLKSAVRPRQLCLLFSLLVLWCASYYFDVWKILPFRVTATHWARLAQLTGQVQAARDLRTWLECVELLTPCASANEQKPGKQTWWRELCKSLICCAIVSSQVLATQTSSFCHRTPNSTRRPLNHPSFNSGPPTFS